MLGGQVIKINQIFAALESELNLNDKLLKIVTDQDTIIQESNRKIKNLFEVYNAQKSMVGIQRSLLADDRRLLDKERAKNFLLKWEVKGGITVGLAVGAFVGYKILK